ncbi:MAG: aspartate kinase, partial [Flavobacteriales bacterium]|nr:aspartate kinase [Flavobacteriales bacterium]
MRVFKFGGASIKDAASVRNVLQILKRSDGEDLVVVISAIGKTTNRLEKLLEAHLKKEDTSEQFEAIRAEHVEIAAELMDGKSNTLIDEINNTLVEVEWALDEPDGLDEHFQYDQIVSIGEMLSTKIVSAYLNANGVLNVWVDARDMIRTDNCYQNARVQWEETEKLTKAVLERTRKKAPIVVTQGFIGGTSENFTTTLGREGSDFTAAILAYCTKADEVVIWKDVPGVLNADPKYFEATELIPHMSYHDAMELAYFGTSVIHPKTVKPLQNADIPLRICSFVDPDEVGTVISEKPTSKVVPSYIIKKNQTLVSIAPTDHSFVVEGHFKEIFSLLDELHIKGNAMQNSAVSFSFSTDSDNRKFEA